MLRPKPKIRKQAIQEILDAHHCDSCAYGIVSESSGEPFYSHVTASGVNDTGTTTAAATRLYAIGSCIKPMINFSLYRLMADGEAVLADNGIREKMRNQWHKSAFELYNELREYRGWDPWVGPKHCKPSVIQVMTHMGGFPAHQRGLLGPDGKILMSEETFGDTFAAMVDKHPCPPTGQFCYSNWNTLLLAFIITTSMRMPLADALEHLVLKYCGMNDTILNQKTFQEKQSYIARPHIQTAVDEPRETYFLNCFDNDAALAVLGGFSCVKDMTIFFERMLKDSMREGSEMGKKLFHSCDTFIHKGATVMSFPTGIYANLDSIASGSESFERIPGSVPHQLGRRSSRWHLPRKPVPATSKAGAIRGYACHFYMIPYQELVIGVMTNTSGIADSSLLVAQYLIQQMLDLKPPMDPFGDRASETYANNQDILVRQATCHRSDRGFNAQERHELRGYYIETTTQQRIVIHVSDDDQNKLSVHLEEGTERELRRSSDMMLIKTQDDILAFLPRPGYLAIDAYRAWRSFGLEIERWEDGKVRALRKAPAHRVSGADAEDLLEFNEFYKKDDNWHVSH